MSKESTERHGPRGVRQKVPGALLHSSLRTPFSFAGICSERQCLFCNNHAAGCCGCRRPQAFENALHDEMATSVDVAAVHRRICAAEWLIEKVPVNTENEISRFACLSFVSLRH